MISFTVGDAATATGAELLRGDPSAALSSVSTDSRTLEAGALFLALSGPNFDGNRFAAAAVERGAAAVVLEGDASSLAPLLESLPARVPVLAHPAPLQALGDLASWYRSRLDIPVFGITGSCGKTTTKNILIEILGKVRRVAGSPSSFNNNIGVPHTIFLADEGTEVLIVEMGTNNPGEIASLARIARPTGGMITNIGASHLEGLRSVEGVAQEKGDLIASLPSSGFGVLNADCRYTPEVRQRTSAPVMTFSVDGDGDLDATDVWFHSAGTTFKLEGREVTTPMLGLHNLQNLLAALAACRGLGVELDEVLPYVSELSGTNRRLEQKSVGGLTLLDDTYNANPESAKASVRVLAGIHGHARRILVLGDMLELGELSAELHHEVGVHAAQSGIDALFLVGELTRATAAGALEGGLESSRILHFDDLEAATLQLPGLLSEGDLVLVKGSRAVGLERLVASLEERLGAPSGRRKVEVSCDQGGGRR